MDRTQADEGGHRRKLIAVLYADMVGYSRLIGLDDLGTLERLKTLRRNLIDPTITEHGGRVVQTGGDSLLVVFDSIDGAVRCAVKVQQQVPIHDGDLAPDQAMRFRVGINIGDAIADETDLHGNAVNVAQRLQAVSPPGGICVSRSVRDHVHGSLGLAFDELGLLDLKNIARPVEGFVLRTEADSTEQPFMDRLPDTLPLPDKPSIAILPFQNLSPDPEQEFFSGGIAEDIITALSRYPSLFVIARNSSFSYKGRAVDVRQIGRELGVRYILKGSLRKFGKRIRVTAQLVEAETDKYIWAERYDRDLADIFAVQDEITDAATIAIAPAIADAEQQRAMRKPPGSLDAWTAYQRALWHLGKATREHHAQAERFFQQAIDLDPNFAGGYRGLADARGFVFGSYHTLDPSEGLDCREILARRAIELDSADAEARSALAHVLAGRGDYQGGLLEANRALAMTPNLSTAHGAVGFVLTFSGQPKEGLASLKTAIRLDPHGSQVAVKMNQMTIAQYYSGDYDAAVEIAKQVIQSYPDYPLTYRWMAAALAQLGRTEQAREALEKAITVAPASFDMYVRKRPPWMRPEDHAHMLDGLRKAGWREE
jgi:adenylate cyclase